MFDHSEPGFGTYRLFGDDTYCSTRHAVKNGCIWIDTAPLYGNQKFVGQALKDCGKERSRYKITTKISRKALESNSKDPDDYSLMKDMFFTSLKDLQIEYVDEVILHQPIDPILNWKRLVKLFQNEGRGLIGRIGVSNFDIDTLSDVIAATGVTPSVNQIELNPFLTRSALVKMCEDHSVDVVAHSPLAKAELLNDDRLVKIASDIGCTSAQAMLWWGIQKKYRVIPRSKNSSHIDENIEIHVKRVDTDDTTLDSLSSLNCEYATHPAYLKKEVTDTQKAKAPKK